MCPGGELLDAVLEGGTYSEETARACFKQLMEGVQYMHRAHVAHRDLKLENLVLVQPHDITRIRIIDFGLAKRDLSDAMRMRTICGTPQYVAPEIVTVRDPGTRGVSSSPPSVWTRDTCSLPGVLCSMLGRTGRKPQVSQGDYQGD